MLTAMLLGQGHSVSTAVVQGCNCRFLPLPSPHLHASLLSPSYPPSFSPFLKTNKTNQNNRNKDFATLASVDYLSDPSHCPASSSSSGNRGPTRHLLLAEGQDPDDYTPTFFIEAAGACTAISVVGGLLLGLGSLMLVQKRPHACVGAAVGLQVRLNNGVGRGQRGVGTPVCSAVLGACCWAAGGCGEVCVCKGGGACWASEV
jgi:hypothetical protein